MQVSGIAFALDEKSALFFLEYNDLRSSRGVPIKCLGLIIFYF